jgi:hypothetical protein
MRVQLIDVDNRLKIKFDKTEGIHRWGDDNAYPSLIKSLIGSSVTARGCSDLNSKYIFGKGFSFVDSVTDKTSLIVNSKGHSINQLLRIISKEFADQNNIFLQINYNALYEVTSVTLLPCTDVRIGLKDSTGYSGKYVVYNNWDRSKEKSVKKEDFQLIDRFNPNPKVIEAQVEKAGGWNKYKGQVLHLNSDFSDTYSLSDLDCAILPADSEHKADIFTNTALNKGFIGQKLFITKPFPSEEEREDFIKTIEDLKGSENSSGVLLLESDAASDVLSEQMLIQNIDTNINDKLFDSTEEKAKQKIIDAFGIPNILVNNSDNSIFGQSGELLKTAKLMHWENREEERNIIIEAFQTIFSKWHEPINPSGDWSIKPVLTLENTTTINE